MIAKRLHNAAEAVDYARSVIAYCDRMTSDYPSVDLGRLRARALELEALARGEPLDLGALRALDGAMQARLSREGTGWYELARYVRDFLVRVEGG